MSFSLNFHHVKSARQVNLPNVADDSLEFRSESGSVDIFVPPHVAAHTAAAFSRAMQAVPDRDAIGEGWTYQGKTGPWHIRCPIPNVYTAQHDEITGDGDPSWMFTEASDLFACMDEIDAIEDEGGCDVCHRLVGGDALTEIDSSMHCANCAEAEAERQRGMAEMAEDDKAHAAMERRAGL